MNDRRAAADGPLERARVLIRIAMQSKEGPERVNAALRAVEHIAKYDLLRDAPASAPGPMPFVTPPGMNPDAVTVGSFVGGMLREIFVPSDRSRRPWSNPFEGPNAPVVRPPRPKKRRRKGK